MSRPPTRRAAAASGFLQRQGRDEVVTAKTVSLEALHGPVGSFLDDEYVQDADEALGRQPGEPGNDLAAERSWLSRRCHRLREPRTT